MRLLIADDNIPFRTSLASILSNIKGIDVVGVAGDVPETIKEFKMNRPDTIILDLHMPGGNGFDVLHTVKSSKPSPIVIMLTVGPKKYYQSLSYLAGADYFFEKSSDLEKMILLLEKSVKHTTSNSLKTGQS
jgi:DNA-binding NarL/FixJ family response regulator